VGLTAQRLVTESLEASGHKEDLDGAVCRPVKNHITKMASSREHRKMYGSRSGRNHYFGVEVFVQEDAVLHAFALRFVTGDCEDGFRRRWRGHQQDH
jgi:hypothetical protein